MLQLSSLATTTYTVTLSGSVATMSKTEKITYPSSKLSGAVYFYSQDGGDAWTTVSGTTTTLTYTLSGSLIARIQYSGNPY